MSHEMDFPFDDSELREYKKDPEQDTKKKAWL
jgi:hypothetical protein